MARASRAERAGQTADRIAARRSRSAKRPAEVPRRTPKRSGRGRAPGGGRRALKLALLVCSFCLVGFFVVLVVDVGARLASRLELGGASVAQLLDKVIDRVLDRDVPRAREPERALAKPKPNLAPSSPPEHARAPRPAARPEDDARHVQARPDPQVERAKQRLDELLRRL